MQTGTEQSGGLQADAQPECVNPVFRCSPAEGSPKVYEKKCISAFLGVYTTIMKEGGKE